MMKTVIAVLASLFLLTGVYSFARADTPVCAGGVWAEQSESFKNADAVVQKLTPDQIENLLNKMGPPPGLEGDFDAYVVTNGPLAAVFIVQDGCTKARLGPSRAEAIDNILGIIRANGLSGEV